MNVGTESPLPIGSVRNGYADAPSTPDPRITATGRSFLVTMTVSPGLPLAPEPAQCAD